MTVYFTGDQHFGHWTNAERNIIKYCNRPFATVEEMDEALIAEWNGVVRANDIVYHHGDFTLGTNAQKYLCRLNGFLRILTLPWHHDHRWLKRRTKESLVTLSGSITYLGVEEVIQVGPPLNYIHLSHYPLANWDRQHYLAAHLHAHSHGNYQGEGKILDVGVDNVAKIWGAYRPVSLEEVVEYMEGR